MLKKILSLILILSLLSNCDFFAIKGMNRKIIYQEQPPSIKDNKYHKKNLSIKDIDVNNFEYILQCVLEDYNSTTKKK